MKDQKTLKDIYRADMTSYWRKSNGEPDQKMIDYCTKKAAYIVELDNDNYYVIDKPSIEKDFCFGYGYCGVSTEEEYQGAARMAEHARTSTDYFMEQNLEPLNRWIEDLKRYSVYKRPHYIGQSESCKEIGLDFIDYYQAAPKNGEELTAEEIARIIEGYQEVKKAFIKRLNTYLKRYGLTKVNSWSFLSD
jgi:hypothetical protein